MGPDAVTGTREDIMQETQEPVRERFAADAGIAIGPILFIIAILGILAAAIAAGSGSFTAGTSSEGNSTKAAALIQIGENLRVGMDRITMENNVTVNNVTIGVNNTTNAVDLFSPTGGGVTIPSVSLANDATSDIWEYVWAEIPGLGSTAEERVAMLNVPSGVCDQVNVKANSLNVAIANYDKIASMTNPVTNNDLGDLTASWPAALTSKPIGCLYDSTNSKYWFYEVLYIQ